MVVESVGEDWEATTLGEVLELTKPYPPDRQEQGTRLVLDQAEVRCADQAAIPPVGDVPLVSLAEPSPEALTGDC